MAKKEELLNEIAGLKMQNDVLLSTLHNQQLRLNEAHKHIEATHRAMPYNSQPCDIITVEFLQSMHPHLTKWQAEYLLKFCHRNTIRHTKCYGDGSVVYPKWIDEWLMISKKSMF